MREKTRILPWLVALATVACFLPALKNGFVNYDDASNFLQNPYYRGLGWAQIQWMFTSAHMGHYIPLTWLTFGLDYTLWGMDPLGYHLTSVLLHSLNAAAFYFLAKRLLKPDADPARTALAAAFAALLFSVHPLRVDSVAWITERRDVVSGLFFLLTLIAYLKAQERPSPGRRLLPVALFALTLLARANCVTLLGALVVLDVYPLRRLGGASGWLRSEPARAAWKEKVPYVLLAAAAAWRMIVATIELGSFSPIEREGQTLQRVVKAGYILAFHVRKTLFPSELMPFYIRPATFDPAEARFVLGVAAALALTALFWRLRRRWPAGLAVWAYYVVMLSPTLSISEPVFLTADHYSYLSCLGWPLLAGGGALVLARRWGGRAVSALAIAWLLVLGRLTWAQCGVWKDSETLWTHTVRLDPTNYIAHNNLGGYYLDGKEYDKALRHFQESIRHNPKYLQPYVNVAQIHAAQGRPKEAIETLARVQQLKPGHFKSLLVLGDVYRRYRMPAPALKFAQKALAVNPKSADAVNLVGLILLEQGKVRESAGYFEKALALKPDHELARANLARAAEILKKAEGR